MRPLSAIEIIRRCQQDVGDRDAWDAFYRLFYPYVLTYVRAFRLPSASLGEDDVAQEIFLKLIEYFPEVRFQSEPHFRSYLKKVCENYVLDLIRKHEKRTYEEVTEELQIAAQDISPEQMAVESERREALKRLLAELPERCRNLLEDFLGKQMTLVQIARERSIPLGTIYPRFSRCVNELRRLAKKRKGV